MERPQLALWSFKWRNLILMVNSSGNSLFELEMENQVLWILILPLLCADWQWDIPIALVSQYLWVKWEILNFPHIQLWCWTLVWIQKLNKKLKTLQRKAKHSPPCPPVPYKSVSGGILWSSLELKQGRATKVSRVSQHTDSLQRYGLSYYNSHSYFAFELLFFFQNFTFFPVWPKVKSLLHYECPEHD